jgi:hypothetical protein
MRIKLSDGWFIEDDVYGYTIYQEALNDKGLLVRNNLSYPTTLERCIDVIMRTNINQRIEDTISLKEYVQAMKLEFTTFMNEVNQHINGTRDVLQELIDKNKEKGN